MNPYSTDEAVLSELGVRLAAARLARNMTQAELAREAGISKRTLERIEGGRSTQCTNLVRVLRAIGLLEGLDRLVPPVTPGPMEQLKRAGKPRKRASGSSPAAKGETWTWGDEP